MGKRHKLGEGADGTVCRGKSKITGEACAVKTIQNCNLTVKHKMEIELMQSMNHPNIIKLQDAFANRRNTYIVMELCLGGELFDRLADVGAFSETHSAIVMQQVLQAMM